MPHPLRTLLASVVLSTGAATAAFPVSIDDFSAQPGLQRASTRTGTNTVTLGSVTLRYTVSKNFVSSAEITGPELYPVAMLAGRLSSTDPSTFGQLALAGTSQKDGPTTYSGRYAKGRYTVTLSGPVPDYRFPKSIKARGAATPTVTIRVFDDFECPYCKQLNDTVMPGLIAWLPKDARLEILHFPLDTIHPRAHASAVAAECAARQNRFFDYEKLLFANQSSWSRVSGNAPFIELASRLKLNAAAFASCLRDPSVESVIAREQAAGVAARVQGTPTIFVGSSTVNWADLDAIKSAYRRQGGRY